jgi:hypothetical protein
MIDRSFVHKPNSSPEGTGIEELEAAKTAALTRMHPEEVGSETAMPEAATQAFLARNDNLESVGDGAGDVTDFQLRINSIESNLDGGVTTFEGQVQIEEYLNNEFISRIAVMVSVIGEETTPVGEVEERLLQAAQERLRQAGSLSLEVMQASLKRTRRDEDVAYSTD